MNTAAKRAKGMLKFDSPPQNYAAIFKMPFFGFFPLVHTMGMKFPIDIFFCDSNKRVLFFRREVQPGRFVMPWKYFFFGIGYLVEFSNCPTSELAVGDLLDWSNS